MGYTSPGYAVLPNIYARQGFVILARAKPETQVSFSRVEKKSFAVVNILNSTPSNLGNVKTLKLPWIPLEF